MDEQPETGLYLSEAGNLVAVAEGGQTIIIAGGPEYLRKVAAMCQRGAAALEKGRPIDGAVLVEVGYD